MPAPSQVKEERAASPNFTWRKMIVFGSLLSAILLSANALVCWTWSYFFDWPGWIVWQIFPGALAIAFIPATILRFRSNHPAQRILYAFSASWLGALNFAFFASVACWIVEAIVSITANPWSHSSIATIFFSLALMTTVYGLFQAACLQTTRVTVKLPNLPEAWQGRTIALVTDLHLGPLFGADFLRRILARLRTLKPEAVFVSGDMFDGPTLGLEALVAPWSEFSAPRGIFYVTGNHDEFADRSLYLEPVSRLGIRVLNNEKVSLDGLQIVGVHDSEAGNPTHLRSILRQVQIDRRQSSILLVHRPINISLIEEEGISLQLSGHTHKGQIWPWNLLVSLIYGRFGHGLARLGKLQVYTSHGVGTWGPPLRVATKSEIVLIRLENDVVEG